MPLLSAVASRYVLLVVDEQSGSLATWLRPAVGGDEIVSCRSPEAAWSLLESGRPYSAVIARRSDGDLEAAASRLATPLITVRQDSRPADVAAAVRALAPPIRQPLQMGPGCSLLPPRPGGRLVAVCGPGGTGTSTIAAALALTFGRTSVAALWSGPRPATGPRPEAAGTARRARVVLADFALRADQSFLHGVADPTTGLLDLLDIGRFRPITAVDVRRHTVAAAGTRLVPGLRRPCHWTAVSPGAFDTVLSGLLGIFDLVIADITGELEGETECGSIDVEERNHMARRTIEAADMVVVVGGPGAHGSRRLASIVNDLLDHGVDPARIQPVANQIRLRSAETDRPRVCGLPAAPVAVAFMTSLDEDGVVRLSPDAAQPLTSAVAQRLAHVPVPDRTPSMVPVAPGSLGCAAS